MVERIVRLNPRLNALVVVTADAALERARGQVLDVLPKGRDEGRFTYPMDWLERHDSYDRAAPIAIAKGLSERA